MTMEERIELGAKAAWKANMGMVPERLRTTWDGETEQLRENWRVFIRAALMASTPELFTASCLRQPMGAG